MANRPDPVRIHPVVDPENVLAGPAYHDWYVGAVPTLTSVTNALASCTSPVPVVLFKMTVAPEPHDWSVTLVVPLTLKSNVSMVLVPDSIAKNLFVAVEAEKVMLLKVPVDTLRFRAETLTIAFQVFPEGRRK
jgi:hypothetical protein